MLARRSIQLQNISREWTEGHIRELARKVINEEGRGTSGALSIEQFLAIMKCASGGGSGFIQRPYVNDTTKLDYKKAEDGYVPFGTVVELVGKKIDEVLVVPGVIFNIRMRRNCLYYLNSEASMPMMNMYQSVGYNLDTIGCEGNVRQYKDVGKWRYELYYQTNNLASRIDIYNYSEDYDIVKLSKTMTEGALGSFSFSQFNGMSYANDTTIYKQGYQKLLDEILNDVVVDGNKCFTTRWATGAPYGWIKTADFIFKTTDEFQEFLGSNFSGNNYNRPYTLNIYYLKQF